jgi:hypothetical protein
MSIGTQFAFGETKSEQPSCKIPTLTAEFVTDLTSPKMRGAEEDLQSILLIPNGEYCSSS